MSRIERRPSSGWSSMGKKSIPASPRVGGTRARGGKSENVPGPNGAEIRINPANAYSTVGSHSARRYPIRSASESPIGDPVPPSRSHLRQIAYLVPIPRTRSSDGSRPAQIANGVCLGRRRNTTVPVPVRCLWTMVPDLMRALLAGGFLVVDRGRCTFPACACCTAGHAAHVRSAHEGPN